MYTIWQQTTYSEAQIVQALNEKCPDPYSGKVPKFLHDWNNYEKSKNKYHANYQTVIKSAYYYASLWQKSFKTHCQIIHQR